MLTFTLTELFQLLDYVPADSPLYKEILGERVSKQYYEFKRSRHWRHSEAELDAWISNLSEAEMEAWNDHQKPFIYE